MTESELGPSQKRTLTNKQKELIRRRDGHKCQFPGEHDCNGDTRTLHVHHIVPFAWMTRRLRRPASEADSPLNLISVCPSSHIGDRRKTNPVRQKK